MSAIDFLYTGVLELIVEYGDILEYFSLLTTNKTLFITFFECYKSQILDINKYATNFQKTGIWNIINNQKRDLFFIEINIKLLFKKLDISLIVNTEITTVLNLNLNKYKIPIQLFINNSYLIDMIHKLITRGDHLFDIARYAPRLISLYTSDNSLFIDKLITRGDHLFDIARFVSELISLYTSDNSLFIDKLMYRGDHLFDIARYAPRLISLYTSDNSLFIDKLMSRGDHLFDIARYAPRLISLYTSDNSLFIDKLMYRGDHLFDIAQYAPRLISLYTSDNKLFIDKLMSRGDHLFDISQNIINYQKG